MGVTERRLDMWTAEKIDARGSLTRRAIDEYTLKKLSRTVEHAISKSTFYREKYKSCDREKDKSCDREKDESCDREKDVTRDQRKPCSFRSYEEFRRLPFTEQYELRERAMDFLCVRPGEISRIVTLDTGGTTGSPKRIYFTEEDQQLTVDFFQNGMQLMADSSDIVLILMPARVPGSIGKLLAKGLRGFGAHPVEYGLPEMRITPRRIGEAAATADEFRQIDAGEDGEKEPEKLLRLMKERCVTGVVALPTHMEMLADTVLRKAAGGQAASGDGERHLQKLKWVLLSAEYVDPEQVKKIEKAFDCKVYEHYGMTEMGLGCAVSCGFGKGYHVRESDIYIEIIDPETGEPVKDGEPGEIDFKTLTRKGMPFIRYRTGDFSRWLTEECSCGSILKRLDKVGPRDKVKGYLKGE